MEAPITIIEESLYLEGYKELKKKKRWDILDKLDKILIDLSTHNVTTKYRNHILNNLNGISELHVSGDILLFYKYKNQGTELEILNLIDLTDHKNLKNPKYQKMIKKRYNSSYEVNDMNKEQLNEAPTQFTIPRDLLNDPDKLDVGEIAKKANADAIEAQKKAELAAKGDNLYHAILADERMSSPDPYDKLEAIFEVTVPASGKADTLAGEIARAMMRLNYRNYNDGDVFFSGYGLETCAPSAQFLMDSDPSIEETIQEIVDNAKEYDYDIDSDYEVDLRQLTEVVVDLLENNPHLFGVDNTEDSRETDPWWIKENRPTYEFEPDTSSEDLERLLDKGAISDSDVYQAVEDIAYDLAGKCDVDRIYRNGYVITGLDLDGLESLEQSFDRHFNQWVEDQVEEYSEEDDWYDEDEEENVDESLSEDFDPDLVDEDFID